MNEKKKHELLCDVSVGGSGRSGRRQREHRTCSATVNDWDIRSSRWPLSLHTQVDGLRLSDQVS